ncbi:MAG: glycosyltransferase family 4 protein [Pseudoalteromonas nigrifaciens]
MKKAIRILLLSNMGPSESKPNSGRFIMNQYLNLKDNPLLKVDYFYLIQEKRSLFTRLTRYPLFFIRFFMRYICSFKKLDVIHVHFYFPNIILAIAYKLLRNWRVKIVVTFHGSDIYLYSPPSRIYKACTYFIDKYIFVSEKLKQRFFKPVKSSVLSAGVSDVFYQGKTLKHLVDKNFDVVFVGHLDKNKGIERLERILINFPCKIRVAIVGAGDFDFINRLKVNKNVDVTHFTDRTPEQLVTIYNASYLLINLSYKESFGLVMSEAMACGIPVVATKTDGACAQIINNSNGFIVENNDDSVCSSAINCIQHILNMPEDNYMTLSKKATNSAQQYRLSLVTEQIFNMYTELRANNFNEK